jgi:phosphohistidine phosphatase
MHLILWRHAEAADGSPDLTRPLTAKGHKQAEDMARWLKPRLPRNTRILVSPALRTRETAQYLSRHFETVPDIAPDASPEAVLAAADWPETSGAVLVVGHQPTLGEVAALLLAGAPLAWSVRKGGLWWLSHRVRDETAEVVPRAVMNPDLL